MIRLDRYDDDGRVRLGDVSRHFGLPIELLRDLIAEGQIPAVQRGGRPVAPWWWVLPADVDRWIDSRVIRSRMERPKLRLREQTKKRPRKYRMWNEFFERGGRRR